MAAHDRDLEREAATSLRFNEYRKALNSWDRTTGCWYRLTLLDDAGIVLSHLAVIFAPGPLEAVLFAKQHSFYDTGDGHLTLRNLGKGIETDR